MAILVDEARWAHRDHLWCHLISDESLDELHDFARSLGLPERLFHGDHYDLLEMYRPDALDAGASAVTSRDLVRRLRAAGLRCTPAQRQAVKDNQASAPSAAPETGLQSPDHEPSDETQAELAP